MSFDIIQKSFLAWKPWGKDLKKKVKIRGMNIFFLLDSSIQKLITPVWKGLTVMGTSSPMQTSKFNQGIIWSFTNLARTYEKCCMCFLQKKPKTKTKNKKPQTPTKQPTIEEQRQYLYLLSLKRRCFLTVWFMLFTEHVS